MKKILGISLLTIALGACDSSNDEEQNTPVTPPETPINLQTTKVDLKFNLPANEAVLDTQAFIESDALTYNAAVGFDVCDPAGEPNQVSVYFVHVESSKWDMYLQMDDELLDVENGELGGTGQYKASLLFDENGDFIKQEPYLIKTTTIKKSNVEYQIEFDLYTDPSTSLPRPFNTKLLKTNGC